MFGAFMCEHDHRLSLALAPGAEGSRVASVGRASSEPDPARAARPWGDWVPQRKLPEDVAISIAPFAPGSMPRAPGLPTERSMRGQGVFKRGDRGRRTRLAALRRHQYCSPGAWERRASPRCADSGYASRCQHFCQQDRADTFLLIPARR